MPNDDSQAELMPQERLREVASILARGVARWRKQVKSSRLMPDSGARKPPDTGLATCFETRLSVSHDTRGLGLRDDGDEA